MVPQDRSAAEARLRDAESAVALAEERVRKSVIRAPHRRDRFTSSI